MEKEMDKPDCIVQMDFEPDDDDPRLEVCRGTFTDAECDPFVFNYDGDSVSIKTEGYSRIVLGPHELDSLLWVIEQCQERGLP